MKATTQFILCVALLAAAAAADAQAPDTGADHLLEAHNVAIGTEMFSQNALNALAQEMIEEQQTPQTPSQAPTEKKSYKPYWLMYALLTATTVYDVETTFHRLGQCPNDCMEGNPVVRPFVERGRAATYAYTTLVNGIIMYVARRMFNRGHDWWRIFPMAVSGVHIAAGSWNLYLAAHPEE